MAVVQLDVLQVFSIYEPHSEVVAGCASANLDSDTAISLVFRENTCS